MEKIEKEMQLLKVSARSKLELNGVEAVSAFDENLVELDTTLGRMYIEGEGLKIVDLSEELGKIIVTGTINSIAYQGTKEKRRKGLFG